MGRLRRRVSSELEMTADVQARQPPAPPNTVEYARHQQRHSTEEATWGSAPAASGRDSWEVVERMRMRPLSLMAPHGPLDKVRDLPPGTYSRSVHRSLYIGARILGSAPS